MVLSDKNKLAFSWHQALSIRPDSPIGIMNVARDITPLKREQEELINSQYFVKSILDTSPNIIYLFNLEEKRFYYGNPGIKTILNYE